MSGEERKGAEFLRWLLSPSMCVQSCKITNRFWNEKHLTIVLAFRAETERFRLTKGYLSSIHNINNILDECSFVNCSTYSYRIVWDTTVHHEGFDFFCVWCLDLTNLVPLAIFYWLLHLQLGKWNWLSMLMLAICPQSFAPFSSGLYASSTMQLMLRIKKTILTHISQ